MPSPSYPPKVRINTRNSLEVLTEEDASVTDIEVGLGGVTGGDEAIDTATKEDVVGEDEATVDLNAQTDATPDEILAREEEDTAAATGAEDTVVGAEEASAVDSRMTRRNEADAAAATSAADVAAGDEDVPTVDRQAKTKGPGPRLGRGGGRMPRPGRGNNGVTTGEVSRGNGVTTGEASRGNNGVTTGEVRKGNGVTTGEVSRGNNGVKTGEASRGNGVTTSEASRGDVGGQGDAAPGQRTGSNYVISLKTKEESSNNEDGSE